MLNWPRLLTEKELEKKLLDIVEFRNKLIDEKWNEEIIDELYWMAWTINLLINKLCQKKSVE